ncbi:hypothetical protein [Streptomyces sp. NPDC057702]|uniref:hypothetical protein n=1 Tax=unclassified Streptomyces TaxID=2593676 RepID=UPI0036A433F5
MSTATIASSPLAPTTSGFGAAPLPSGAPAACATASAPRTGEPARSRRPLGTAMHAVKAFAGAAFRVAVLGDYADAGVRKR